MGAQAGDSIPAKIDPASLRSLGRIEEGLEHSRVMACPAVASLRRRKFCISAQAFGSTGRSCRPTLNNQLSTLNQSAPAEPRAPLYSTACRAFCSSILATG